MMSGKAKFHPLNGPHTSGIYSDVSIDGPEIGTLVVIVDRAKNLPNRRTIGKQDPYCAARLGKEAKKTTTDIRGGQTPKWDQELRFTVHDSPDYFQLKLSVFNDDRKTDLIGETWIDLKSIIVPHGGQADLWQALNCRGKYSGEIRIEITFYDTRNKPESSERATFVRAPLLSVAVASSPPTAPAPFPVAPVVDQQAEMDGRSSLRGPARRRPLPSDPPTSAQLPHPIRPAVPSHGGHAPLRKQSSYQASPPQSTEYHTPPPPLPTQRQPLHQSEYYTPPSHASSLVYHNPPTPRKMSYSRSMDHFTQSLPPPPPPPPPQQQQQQQQQHDSRNQAAQYVAYLPGNSRSGSDLHHNYVADESRHELHLDSDRPPPPPAHRTRNPPGTGVHGEVVLRSSYDPSKAAPSMRHGVLRHEAHRHSMSAGPALGSRPAFRHYESVPVEPAPSHSGSDHASRPSQPSLRIHSLDGNNNNNNNAAAAAANTATNDDHYEHIRSMQPTVEDAPESPQTLSSQAILNSAKRNSHRSSLLMYEVAAPPYDKTATPAPLKIGAGKQTSQSSTATTAYVTPVVPPSAPPAPPYDARRNVSPLPTVTPNDYAAAGPGYDHSLVPARPRRGSYVELPYEYDHPPAPVRRGSFVEQGYEPAVVAIAPAPAPAPGRRGSFVENNYDAPLPRESATPVRRGSFVETDHSPSPAPGRRGSFVENNNGYDPLGYAPDTAPVRRGSFLDRGDGFPAMARRGSAYENYENALVHVPSVPPSLVPGIGPEFAQEISDRIYEGSRNVRYSNAQHAVVSARGRPRTDTYPQYDRDISPAPYASGSFDRRSPGYETHSPVHHPPPSHSRGVSPNPVGSGHRSPRKSVSPAPPPLSTSPGFQGGGGGGGGGHVPFGPDSFDVLNPSSRNSARPEPENKIITHDGREIDPSDHLPIESWAPEPEGRPRSQEQSRSALTGAQPMPPSGRRQLRIAQRPQSMAASPSPVYHHHHQQHMGSGDERVSPGLPPPATGRGRLQKKTQRHGPPSPAAVGGSGGSGPPGRPTSSHSYQDDNGSGVTPPRAVPRTTTWGYPGESAAPVYGTSPGAADVSPSRGGNGPSFAHRQTMDGPPVPAMVPMHEVGDWALMQEISRIDLGTGRSRRHARY